MSDFWDEFSNAFVVESAIDHVLQGRELGGPTSTSMQDLTDKGRAAKALKLPVEAGQRVRFIANVGSVLTYDDVPGDGVEGTVVRVKTPEGKLAFEGDLVFVQWDDGKFRPIMAEHLRPGASNKKLARNLALRVASLDMVGQFFAQHSGSSDELVHRATKDLWSFRKDQGGYVIERLFNYDGRPLKV